MQGWVRYDIPVIRAIRETVGPDYPLMLDNFTTYTLEEAVEVGKVLDELDFLWYESPMPETDDWLEAYIALGREVRTPLCAPETNPGTHLERLAWTDRHAVDINRIDQDFGGITSCLKLAAHCEETGVRMEFHSGGHLGLNLTAAVPESVAEYYEYYDARPQVYVERARALELGQPLEEIRMFGDPYVRNPLPGPDRDGYLTVPQRPGVGIEHDWDCIYSRKVPKSQTA